mmetsp:Transcript_24483/g.57449  ORF Transcript_24483/g.57449 Transcript_24483/m.57449 type:complete len:307 (-) Transcript_24483:522-1442(-)
MPCFYSSRPQWELARTHQDRPTPVRCRLPRHFPREGKTPPQPPPTPPLPSMPPPQRRIWFPPSCLPWRMAWRPTHPYREPRPPHLFTWASRQCRPLLSTPTLVSTVPSMARQAPMANGRVQPGTIINQVIRPSTRTSLDWAARIPSKAQIRPVLATTCYLHRPWRIRILRKPPILSTQQQDRCLRERLEVGAPAGQQRRLIPHGLVAIMPLRAHMVMWLVCIGKRHSTSNAPVPIHRSSLVGMACSRAWAVMLPEHLTTPPQHPVLPFKQHLRTKARMGPICSFFTFPITLPTWTCTISSCPMEIC